VLLVIDIDAEESGVPLDLKRAQSIYDDRSWFNFQIANPYFNITLKDAAIGIANHDMRESYTGFTDVQQYAPTQGFIDDNFGDVSTDRSRSADNFVGGISNLNPDNTSITGLVWGRDGVGGHAEAKLSEQ